MSRVWERALGLKKLGVSLPAKSKNLSIAIFGYQWTGHYDDYQQGLQNWLVENGCDVSLWASNYASATGHVVGLNKDVNFDALKSQLEEDFDLILSLNAGGLTSQLRKSCKIPIITILLDDPAHCFKEDRKGFFENLESRKNVLIFTSLEQVEMAKLAAGEHREKNRMLLPAGSFLTAPKVTKDTRREPYFIEGYPYFLGTIPDDRDWVYNIFPQLPDTVVDRILSLGDMNTLKFIDIINSDFPGNLEEDKWKMAIAYWNHQSSVKRQNLLSRLITGNPLFRVYTNYDGYVRLLDKIGTEFSSQIRMGPQSPEDFKKFYQKNKISLNINQCQSPSAIPYRVYDNFVNGGLTIIEAASKQTIEKMEKNSDGLIYFSDFDELDKIIKQIITDGGVRLSGLKKESYNAARSFEIMFEKVGLLQQLGGDQKGSINSLYSNYSQNLHYRLRGKRFSKNILLKYFPRFADILRNLYLLLKN